MRKAALLVALLASACGGPSADAEVPPMLDGVDPPAVNEPLRVPRVDEQPAQATPVLPQDQPAVLILRDGQPVAGALRVAGELSVQADRMRLTPAEGSSLDILFRLPEGLTLSERRGLGVVDVADYSGPQGADRLIRVESDGSLALVEVWRRSQEPLRVALGSDLVLQQGTASGEGSGYLPAPVELAWQGRSLGEISPGKASSIDAPSGSLMVFIATSHLHRPDPGSSADESEYILHGWLSPVP